jgi:hypothetical protein
MIRACVRQRTYRVLLSHYPEAPAFGERARRASPIMLSAQRISMLYTLAVVLIILWLLGLVTSTTMGGFIHVLLVIAVVLVLIRLITGRSAI